MLRRLLQNHPLANLTFGLVLVLGALSYLNMPRERNPNINFNWIQIFTSLPGAAAEDVERRITDPLEDAVAKVADIKFVSSSSREGLSSILVRFNDIDEYTFDKRVNDLRREVQDKKNTDLPKEANSPFVFEVTTANAFPTATLVVSAEADDENLRKQAYNIRKDLERFKEVEQVNAAGLNDPELQINFMPEKLAGLGVTAADVADTVAAYFRDIAAGKLSVGGEQWLVRLAGTDVAPGYLAQLPLTTAQGEVRLGDVAEVARARETANDTVRFNGKPAIMLSVNKKGKANILQLVERLNAYTAQRNTLSGMTGVRLTLVDDQTTSTREAISVMQNNALVGLLMVLLITGLFLGTRMAVLISLGVPFALAGTFWLLAAFGQTLNNAVLLGVVIALGMLVDDAVVVVESMYYYLQRGRDALSAALESLREVFAPVTSSVLTTIAAFLPLMLLPGVLGKFMFVIPLVVSVALVVSLIEAYWILPAHVVALRVNFDKPGRIQRRRTRATHALQLNYVRLLVRVLRRPKLSLLILVMLFGLAAAAVGAGMVRVNFFALEPFRLFYVNVQMPEGTPLEETMREVERIENNIRGQTLPGEVRAMVAFAGQMFTATEPFIGDRYGQIMVSLNPQHARLRDVNDVVEALRPLVDGFGSAATVTFFIPSDGPPTLKPISIKVRGDDFGEIRAAAAALHEILGTLPAVKDITDDAGGGRKELVLRLNLDAVRRAGVNPHMLTRHVRLLVDGEVVTSLQDQGEKVEVRVRRQPRPLEDVEALLRTHVALPGGGEMALGQLVDHEVGLGRSNIRHYNFRRAVSVEADLDKEKMDTLAANKAVQQAWQKIQARYPNINLDFSGELDDVQESLDAMILLFLFGVGLIYLILGTQFRSYWQPLMILFTVPMAFTGVVLGLIITRHPLSLYTLYGVVALTGIAVNAAIVLISAANERRARGMSVLHATLYAARRRVIPILITSLTTIAGLFSLAVGFAGHSPVWGPVATAIIWGLGFSTVLTLFVIPLLYRLFMGRARRLV